MLLVARTGCPRVEHVVREPRVPPHSGRHPQRVDVLDEILAGDDHRAGVGGALRRKHALTDQFLRRVACHQPRVWIDRVPAGRVAVEHASESRGNFSEVPIARQAATSKSGHVVHKLVDPPARPGHRTSMAPTRWDVQAAHKYPRDRGIDKRPLPIEALSEQLTDPQEGCDDQHDNGNRGRGAH